MDNGDVTGSIEAISTALGFRPNWTKPYGWHWFVNGEELLIAHEIGDQYRYYGPHWIIEGLLSGIDGITISPV